MKKSFLKSSLFIALLGVFMTNTITFTAIKEDNVIEKNIINNNEWIEKPLRLSITEKNNETYILMNKNTGEEITDIYETLNGIIKKLSAEEALDRLNKIPVSELNNNENQDYIEDYFKKTSGPNEVIGSPKNK